MNEWKTLSTLQEVAEAQKNGEEIEFLFKDGWFTWPGTWWTKDSSFRSRPAKKTKTVVLREALLGNNITGTYRIVWLGGTDKRGDFVRWLDTPERIVEVEE